MSDETHTAEIDATESSHNFVCDIEPQGDGGWKVWISEAPYRGVNTDATLGTLGERKRIGGGWTSRWYVGRSPLAFTARRLAVRMIRKAHALAATNDAEGDRWRANVSRESIRVTSADAATRDIPPEEPR